LAEVADIIAKIEAAEKMDVSGKSVEQRLRSVWATAPHANKTEKRHNTDLTTTDSRARTSIFTRESPSGFGDVANLAACPLSYSNKENLA
jgi:hypothetical protein